MHATTTCNVTLKSVLTKNVLRSAQDKHAPEAIVQSDTFVVQQTIVLPLSQLYEYQNSISKY